jgi:hypothetical protein
MLDQALIANPWLVAGLYDAAGSAARLRTFLPLVNGGGGCKVRPVD